MLKADFIILSQSFRKYHKTIGVTINKAIKLKIAKDEDIIFLSVLVITFDMLGAKLFIKSLEGIKRNF